MSLSVFCQPKTQRHSGNIWGAENILPFVQEKLTINVKIVGEYLPVWIITATLLNCYLKYTLLQSIFEFKHILSLELEVFLWFSESILRGLCHIPPTWHLYRFLKNAPFLLPDWFFRTLYFLAFYRRTFRGLVLWLSGCGVTLWLDHTQPAVLQSLLQRQNTKHHNSKTLKKPIHYYIILLLHKVE